LVDLDPATGQSHAIRRVMLTEANLDALSAVRDPPSAIR
jgi:hypothetical protein